MYAKVDQAIELENIKILGLQSWSGRKQKYLKITAGGNVLEYCFKNRKDYSDFIRELRKIENEEREDAL